MAKVSAQGIELIKHFEHFEPKAYICPTGHLTIGYGTIIDTSEEEYLKHATLTEPQASQLLTKELSYYQDQVSKLAPGVNQSQFDALTSFAFNCGVKNLSNSTLLKLVKVDPNNPLITNEFNKWVHGEVDGKIETLAGLQKRRASEAYLYFNEHLKFY